MERSGEVVLLKEIFADRNCVGKYVRVTGYVSTVNTKFNLLEITHDECSLSVDVSLVDIGSIKLDALVQFIGEIQSRPAYIQRQEQGFDQGSVTGNIILAARVCRIVDGLDLRLYEEALRARREFLIS